VGARASRAIFDRYGESSFKYGAIDAANDRLLIGHYTQKSGWAIDASMAAPIQAGQDHTLNVTLKGTTVSAKLNPQPNGSAQALVGFAFNAATVGQLAFSPRERQRASTTCA
jgi:hypothetical protein